MAHHKRGICDGKTAFKFEEFLQTIRSFHSPPSPQLAKNVDGSTPSYTHQVIWCGFTLVGVESVFPRSLFVVPQAQYLYCLRSRGDFFLARWQSSSDSNTDSPYARIQSLYFSGFVWKNVKKSSAVGIGPLHILNNSLSSSVASFGGQSFGKYEGNVRVASATQTPPENYMLYHSKKYDNVQYNFNRD